MVLFYFETKKSGIILKRIFLQETTVKIWSSVQSLSKFYAADQLSVVAYLNSVLQSVKDDLAVLKSSSLIRKELSEHAHGFVFDIKTGLLSPV